MLFLFYKIGVTQTIFNLSGKTPFAKEILKICFKMTNISSDTLLTNSADIWSYPELLFDLRLANLFSSFKSVRLLVLRQGTSQWIYFSNQVLLSGMEAAKLGPILTKQLINAFAISFLPNISVFHRDKTGKRGITDSFVSDNFFYSMPGFFDIIFAWINKIWIVVFLWFLLQRFKKWFVLFIIQFLFRVPILQNFDDLFDDFTNTLVIQGLLKHFRLVFLFCFGNTSL